MIPITLANVQAFCRVCLRELMLKTPTYKPNHEMEKENLYDLLRRITGVSQNHCKIHLYPNKVCHSCYIKMVALDAFREKFIISAGVLTVTILDNLKQTTIDRLKIICRVCLKYTNNNINIREKEELIAGIAQCSNLQLNGTEDSEIIAADDSRFPQMFCGKCFSKLKTFMSFKTLAQQTELYLKSLLVDEAEIVVKNEPVEQETEFVDQPPAINFEQESLAHKAELTSNINTDCKDSKSSSIIKTEFIDIALETEEFTSIIEPLTNFEVLKVEKNPLNDENVFDLSETNNTNMEAKKSVGIHSESHLPTAETTKNHGSKKFKRSLTIKNESKSDKYKRKKQKTENLKKHRQCPKCDRFFYKQNLLEAHIKSAHEGVERPFVCDLCPSSFRQHSALERHRILLHMPKKPMLRDVDVFAPPNANMHICMTCLKQFKRKDILEQHINTAHTDKELRPFKCKHCQKGFGSKRTMQRHEQNHSKERPFACEFCSKRYNRKAELSTHMQRHTTNPDLLCPICKRGKPNAEELQKHIAMHEASRQHQCPICGRVFTKLFHLREHENAVHLKLRPFKCTYCEKTFATRRTQKEHEQLHDPTTRPIFCILCTMHFKNENTLSRHMTKEHNQLPKKLRAKQHREVDKTVIN